jgi:hypothetical protein
MLFSPPEKRDFIIYVYSACCIWRAPEWGYEINRARQSARFPLNGTGLPESCILVCKRLAKEKQVIVLWRNPERIMVRPSVLIKAFCGSWDCSKQPQRKGRTMDIIMRSGSHKSDFHLEPEKGSLKTEPKVHRRSIDGERFIVTIWGFVTAQSVRDRLYKKILTHVTHYGRGWWSLQAHFSRLKHEFILADTWTGSYNLWDGENPHSGTENGNSSAKMNLLCRRTKICHMVTSSSRLTSCLLPVTGCVGMEFSCAD